MRFQENQEKSRVFKKIRKNHVNDAFSRNRCPEIFKSGKGTRFQENDAFSSSSEHYLQLRECVHFFMF